MIIRSIKISFYLLFIAAFLGVFYPALLKAEANSREEIISQAFAEAKSEPEAVTKATDKASVETTYRQKLQAEITKEEEETTHEVDSFFRYMPSRSLKAQPGKITMMESEIEYSYQFKAFDKLPVELALGSQYINIDKKDGVPLSLPSQLTALVMGAQVTLPFFNLDKTYLRFRVEPSFFSDNWNASSSSFRLPSLTYLIYQPNEKWIFICGVAVSPSSDDIILPVAGFIYKPNDKLTFNILPDRPNISYEITDRIGIFVDGGMSASEYRINKDDFQGVILSYNELHVGAGLKFTINKYIEASVSAGRMFNRYLKYNDSLGKVNLKNDLYSEFRVEIGI